MNEGISVQRVSTEQVTCCDLCGKRINCQQYRLSTGAIYWICSPQCWQKMIEQERSKQESR